MEAEILQRTELHQKRVVLFWLYIAFSQKFLF